MEFKFFVVLIYNIKKCMFTKNTQNRRWAKKFGRQKSKLKIERAPCLLSQSSALLKESSTNSCYCTFRLYGISESSRAETENACGMNMNSVQSHLSGSTRIFSLFLSVFFPFFLVQMFLVVTSATEAAARKRPEKFILDLCDGSAVIKAFLLLPLK